MADFFKPLDPFSQQKAWAEKHFPDTEDTLHVRPIYVPDDLRSLQRWTRDPHNKINTVTTGDHGRLLKHYKRRSVSNRSQSFMVLRDEEPVCQFDIKGAESDPLYFLMPTHADDCILNCLIPPTTLDCRIWISGLSMLLELYFSLPGSGSLFVPAPLYPVDFTEGLEHMGFKKYREVEGLDPLIGLWFKER